MIERIMQQFAKDGGAAARRASTSRGSTLKSNAAQKFQTLEERTKARR
jgi:hypothetical protein